jgi:hypothetical protein
MSSPSGANAALSPPRRLRLRPLSDAVPTCFGRIDRSIGEPPCASVSSDRSAQEDLQSALFLSPNH